VATRNSEKGSAPVGRNFLNFTNSQKKKNWTKSGPKEGKKADGKRISLSLGKKGKWVIGRIMRRWIGCRTKQREKRNARSSGESVSSVKVGQGG